MPVILVPSVTSCHECDIDLKVQSRMAKVTVYTDDGIKQGHSYHKKCPSCDKLYYYTYSRKDNERTFYSNSSSFPYFLISSVTAFSRQMVESCCAQIEEAAVSFDSLADQYYARTDHTVDKQRIEEMYFIWKLIGTYSLYDEHLVMSNDEVSYRKDIETSCKHALDTMINLSTLAEKHSCDTPGCKEGFIMADGVEKESKYPKYVDY